MTWDRRVFGLAGSVTLLSVGLAHFVSPWWLWLTVFAGANMLLASVTGLCAAAALLRRVGLSK